MKKILIVIGLLLIFVPSSLFIYMYKATMNSKNDGMQEAKSRIGEYLEGFELQNSEVYFGDKKYFIFEGLNVNKEGTIIFVPESKDDEIITEKVTNALTKQDVQKYLEEKYNPSEIISIKLGMRDKVPLWEATYVVETGNYVYEFLDFHTGDLLKKYTLKK